MQELVRGRLEEEELEYKCEHCDSQAAVVHKEVVEAPPVLILQLKRFEEALDNTPEAAVDGSWRVRATRRCSGASTTTRPRVTATRTG